MASSMSHSEEEDGRAVRMAEATLDLMNVEMALRDGRLDEQTNASLLKRREEAARDLDPEFALELASRLGEEALRDAVEQNCPPSCRASIDALMQREGGMLPLVQNRIRRLQAVPVATFLTDGGVPCVLGAFAIVDGVFVNKILGGAVAVAGVVMVASYC